MSKIINKKNITIITVILYSIAMLAFELFYCNSTSLANLIQGQGWHYHFSLCRIVMYLSFFILYFIFKDKFIEEAIQVSNNRYKRIIIYGSVLLTIITILLTVYVALYKIEYMRSMSIVLITIAMASVFAIYVCNDHIKNIVITILTIGMIFTITTKFNHPLDEIKHFWSAFNMAFFRFDYANQAITDSQIEKLPNITKYDEIDEFLNKKYIPQISEKENMEDIGTTPTTYHPLIYIVASIGIFLAKTLGGSIIDLYIMGRLFNLILYGVLIGIAVKLLPYKKNILLVIALMPEALLLAASYSIDGICIGIVSIFIAYCLKLKNEREILQLKDIFSLAGMFILLLLVKSMAYVMVGFMIFTLPIIPTLKKNKKYLPVIGIVFAVACIILVTLALYIKNTKIVSDIRAGENVSVSEQLNHVMHHPIFDIRLMILHVRNTLLNFNWLMELHNGAFFTTNATAVMLFLILFIGYVALTEDDYNFKIKDKIILILSFFLTFFMTSMVLYLSFTRVGELAIDGYQARYIFPIVSLLLFCASNCRVKSVNNVNRNMNINMISSAVIIISLAGSIFV